MVDFEVNDVESSEAEVKDEAFSHSMLVFKSMQKCLEAGSVEMREGWFNEKRERSGNIIRTYIADTRKTFIESVRTLNMMMSPDIDDIAEKEIGEYTQNIKNKYEELIEYENKAWNNLTQSQRMQYTRNGYRHFSRMITDTVLKNHFVEFELEQWRNIFSSLARLTKRLDYYKVEMFTV